ncbi:hypothetical protein QJU89_02895 [Pasteurella skyensis]|uniref:Uncharacterized protein n=1 Tax=Phocoenobacter skyensis TaxID=97481 RepID=A0AAJ6N8W4_9PAST|nr:hypothetical protein [Pasteurella skyensis]MDP8162279.1 hypothetical protein [Pasteurella skyensis]MDP8172387.1 hypothetical protein [Pasteurella skyensis]MDP8178642.1 hypothetical protein [Pasteurella skyensis]MDP8182644.1 hypothetical protein [Pasteurella skyensis]MDP8188949.1 hypothetical protein [Pasteurella skyensis]
MKKLLLASVLGLTLTTSINAQEVSGETNFKVTIPEVLVLYHWDEAHLTFKNMATHHGDTTIRNKTVNFADNQPYTLDGDVTITDLPSFKNDVKVKLKNAWAVRSISNDKVTLKLEAQQPTLKLGGASNASESITISDQQLKLGRETPNATIELKSQWAPQQGDILFNMNLAGATKSGEYKSADKDTFKLTLTGK